MSAAAVTFKKIHDLRRRLAENNASSGEGIRRRRRYTVERALRPYWVSIVCVLDKIFGNGIPRKFGFVVEVLRKITNWYPSSA
jgi:hypothetical protein